ncbi:MAG: hypothetical protein U0031_00645 [Thermomicrobiales bacterium]
MANVILALADRQKRVTIHEPEAGWSAGFFASALQDYAFSHGRGPQTMTMHPDTAAEIEMRHDHGGGRKAVPIVIASREYDRTRITLYY